MLCIWDGMPRTSCWTNGTVFFLSFYAEIVSSTRQPCCACFIPSRPTMLSMRGPNLSHSTDWIPGAADSRLRNLLLLFPFSVFQFHPPRLLSSSCTLSDILRICTGPRNGLSLTWMMTVCGGCGRSILGRTDAFSLITSRGEKAEEGDDNRGRMENRFHYAVLKGLRVAGAGCWRGRGG